MIINSRKARARAAAALALILAASCLFPAASYAAGKAGKSEKIIVIWDKSDPKPTRVKSIRIVKTDRKNPNKIMLKWSKSKYASSYEVQVKRRGKSWKYYKTTDKQYLRITLNKSLNKASFRVRGTNYRNGRVSKSTDPESCQAYKRKETVRKTTKYFVDMSDESYGEKTVYRDTYEEAYQDLIDYWHKHTTGEDPTVVKYYAVEVPKSSDIYKKALNDDTFAPIVEYDISDDYNPGGKLTDELDERIAKQPPEKENKTFDEMVSAVNASYVKTHDDTEWHVFKVFKYSDRDKAMEYSEKCNWYPIDDSDYVINMASSKDVVDPNKCPFKFTDGVIFVDYRSCASFALSSEGGWYGPSICHVSSSTDETYSYKWVKYR
ncbi:MAG: hypothetical protein ACI4LM_07260 [Anaerovoracaceae bacterium]